MNDDNFIMFCLKKIMQPGYIYFLGMDGEIYKGKINNIPKAGETVYFPPMKYEVEVNE